MSKNAIPELSIDTQTIERLLLAVPVGETAQYATLSAAIGKNVQKAARHHLTSAMKRVRKDANMIFAAVRNEGVKRLDDIGKISSARGHIRKIRTQAKLARAKATAIDNYEALPRTAQSDHYMTLVEAGMTLHVTSHATQKKIAASALEPKRIVPLRECLDAMKRTL